MLGDDLVNQIAAGEVVERPASVVKELVENALDAEATRVAIEIAQGGLRSIAVSDDGVGMSRADAERSFLRHATSKIRCAEDLAKVGTLGFRGEALPSIASVAGVRMRTRRSCDAVGVELRGAGQGIERIAETACPVGTRVEVTELFGRVPARRKFLKTPVTEASHALRWVERMGLARPDVRFELERDGRRVLFLPPTADVRERALAVLPHRIGGRLLEVEGRAAGARVYGFATPTDVLRGTTADLHVFVNARPVRDRMLLQAIHQAYRDALPPGRHPVAVLYLDVDPGEVDVNVHPAKQEVRFRDPREIGALVRRSLTAALGRRAFAPAGALASAVFERPPGPIHAREQGLGLGDFAFARAPSPPLADAGPAAPFAFRELRFVGQVLGTFLVLEAPGQLVLMDQHAAHERVLFERMRRSLLDGALQRQSLLAPVWLELPRSAADALAEHAPALGRAGFEVEVAAASPRGGVRVGIQSVPAALAGARGLDWAALLDETAASLRDPDARETRDGIEGALHGVLATAACHAATRRGDRLEPAEVHGLLAALDETVWLPNCPHGRPILSALDEAELGRRFLRH